MSGCNGGFGIPNIMYIAVVLRDHDYLPYLKWGTDAGHGRKAEWVKTVALWATPFNGKGYEQGHGPPM